MQEISRDEALKLIGKYVKNGKLIKHMLAVEAIMRKLAEHFNENAELWGLTGLLHDLDYELTGGDMNVHGLKTVELLKDVLPDEALDAIKCHNDALGFKATSKLAIALKAADHASGLIVATALVMPNKKLEEVKVRSLLKKFKQKDFARGVNRSRILLCEDIGLDLRTFLELSLEALKGIAEELGL